MLAKRRKVQNGLITLHTPVPPCLLPDTTSRDVGNESLLSLSVESSSSSLVVESSSSSSSSSSLESLSSSPPSSSSSSSSSSSVVESLSTESSVVESSSSSSSSVESPCVRSVSPNVPEVITRVGDKNAHSVPSCSVKRLQETFLAEKQEADAITRPLLDNENGFVKDLEGFLERRDAQHARKHELLHKRWTECVWWPVQRSIQQHFIRRRYERPKTRHSDYVIYSGKVTTPALKDPLFLYSRSRTQEKRVVLHCLKGRTDSCLWAMSDEEQRRSERSSRRPSLVYLTYADGRCFRPECWSSIGLSRRCSAKL